MILLNKTLIRSFWF